MKELDKLEIKIQSQLCSCIAELKTMGYDEDNIVAADFTDEFVLFLMTDGKEIKIKPLAVFFPSSLDFSVRND